MFVVTTNVNGESLIPKLFKDKFTAKRYFLEKLFNRAVADGSLTQHFLDLYFDHVAKAKCVADIDDIISALRNVVHLSPVLNGYRFSSQTKKTTIQFFELDVL